MRRAIFKSDRLSAALSGQAWSAHLPKRAGGRQSRRISADSAQAMWAPAQSTGIVTLKSGA